MPKDVILPMKIKNYGKAYCPICDKDTHAMGQIDRCPNCGQAIKWPKGVGVEMNAMEEFEAIGKKQVLEFFGMDLAKGDDFSVTMRRRNNKWEVVKND